MDIIEGALDALSINPPKKPWRVIILRGRAAEQRAEQWTGVAKDLRREQAEKLLAQGLRRTDIARAWSVSPSLVTKILKGER